MQSHKFVRLESNHGLSAACRLGRQNMCIQVHWQSYLLGLMLELLGRYTP